LKKKKRMNCKEEVYAKRLIIKIGKKLKSKFRMLTMKKFKNKNKGSFLN
jgi:hypothetical protein